MVRDFRGGEISCLSRAQALVTVFPKLEGVASLPSITSSRDMASALHGLSALRHFRAAVKTVALAPLSPTASCLVWMCTLGNKKAVQGLVNGV